MALSTGKDGFVHGGGFMSVVTWLFSLSAFLSAFVLFFAEPFMAKLILPLGGGSPAVWNTAMVFYQAALLAGYAWVHWASRRLGWRKLGLVNLMLFVIALLISLPPGVQTGWQPDLERPAWSVFVLLCGSIGLPFILLSCSAPLLQYWFSLGTHANRHNPYFLYAASNFGSMTALLAYPFFIEPWLGLRLQGQVWSFGFVLLTILMAICFVQTWRVAGLSGGVVVGHATQAPVEYSQRWRWIIYAALPAALLIAVTNHISTDIAAIPLLWVIPLALYLLTYVIAFARVDGQKGSAPRVLIAVLIVLAASLTDLTGFRHAVPLVLIDLALLFTVSLACHRRLVSLRPVALDGLTSFYCHLSLGGLIGSLGVALLAPVLFTKVHEYHLLIAAALFALPMSARSSVDRLGIVALGMTLLLVLLILLSPTTRADVALRWVLLGLFMLVMARLSGRPWAQMALFSVLLVICQSVRDSGHEVYAGRSFYGAYIVDDHAGGVRTLSHGTTIHGAQFRDEARQHLPLTYYHPGYLMGDVIRALHGQLPEGGEWGIVGLGTGAMACNAGAQDHVTFFEIDPLMIRIASDPRLFTYLQSCSPKLRIITGDARLTLAQEPDAHYDFLFLDAFSSDAIPVHILTREAMAIYRRKLKPNGLMLFHVSNRHLDLRPVVYGLSVSEGMQAWVSHCPVRPALAEAGASSAVMVLVAAPGMIPASIREGRCWRPLDGRPVTWTDDYSNLWSVLKDL